MREDEDRQIDGEREREDEGRQTDGEREREGGMRNSGRG